MYRLQEDYSRIALDGGVRDDSDTGTFNGMIPTQVHSRLFR